jgi:hypothetical protein
VRTIIRSLLALLLASCASQTLEGVVERGETPVIEAGGGAISEGQMRFLSAPIATRARGGGTHVFDFAFQTRVPLEAVDVQVLDRLGRPDPARTTIRRLGVVTETRWTANEPVNAPAATLDTGDVPVGAFHVYLDVTTDLPVVRFVLTFRRQSETD